MDEVGPWCAEKGGAGGPGLQADVYLQRLRAHAHLSSDVGRKLTGPKPHSALQVKANTSDCPLCLLDGLNRSSCTASPPALSETSS